MLQEGDDAEALRVVIEASDSGHGFVQRVLPGWPNGVWPRSWASADGLDQIFVEAKHARQRAPDLSHFQAVGQPCAVVIALMVQKNLCLMNEPAERRRMHDAVAVALVDLRVGQGASL